MLYVNMIYCPLGSLCHTAELLSSCGVREQAYPFDWISLSPSKILHCIEDDFVSFLDKDQYTLINPHRCGHILYKSVGFFHHQPLIKQGDYEYICRCVDRFRSLMLSNDEKLFFMLNVNTKLKEGQHYQELKDIKPLKSKVFDFDKKFSHYTNNYKLISINHVADNQSISHEIHTAQGIDFIDFYSTSKSDGAKFGSSNDNDYLVELIKSKYVIKV